MSMSAERRYQLHLESGTVFNWNNNRKHRIGKDMVECDADGQLLAVSHESPKEQKPAEAAEIETAETKKNQKKAAKKAE